MNNILIIGAGRSATACINYVLGKAAEHGWNVTVVDADPQLAQRKINNHPNGRAAWLDVTKVNDRRDLIGRMDIVVSLLPAHLHIEVAHDCIQLKKHLITASYVSKSMYQLGDEARDRELIFMGEMGLDPGIDHMSAMKKINEIKAAGGKLVNFRSYTGGLISPECDDNPWHYKFTWNPRNVVLAGQGTAQYLHDGRIKFIPYNRLFAGAETVEIEGFGPMEMYPNRDSLLYREVYGLSQIPNLLRGTLRYPGFCKSWNALVQIGLTDGSYPILESGSMTYHELMDAYTREEDGASVKERIANMLREEMDGAVMSNLDWLGLFRKLRINLPNATPALILENLLLKKWKLEKTDRDMILMQHEFEYELEGKMRKATSTLVMKGEDDVNTAMSKLVGLPLGIFVRLVMQGKITATGVNIPVMQQVYDPVLEELEDFGVVFKEKDVALS